MNSNIKHIIVIGASAGGLNAVTEVLAKLPANLPAAILVVIHLGKASSIKIIKDHLQKHTTYGCLIANDGDTILPGMVYLGPPDQHLLLSGDKIRLTNGPHENRWRPSIDVLFRSAAANYGSAVIGIILTGMLDDGTSGMAAIKRSGGICIVQEPVEAAYPDMPINVLNNVDVDYRVSLADMGYIIDDIFSKPAKPGVPIPEDVILEAKINERMVSNISELEKIGEHSNFVCPDCGGGLWRIKNEKNPRYRCYTGHVYTEDLLLEKHAEELEDSLWVSIRMLEERKNLLLNMAYREKEGGNQQLVMANTERAEEISKHIERLKAFLVSINQKSIPPDEGYH